MLLSSAMAQESAAAEARVIEVLRAHDPARDGRGAVELLGGGTRLDAALRAVAGRDTGAPSVRTRALHLVRLLDLAARTADVKAPRDAAWWLALHTMGRVAPAELRPLLLTRAFASRDAADAALRELDAAAAVVQRFTVDWSETRTLGDDEQNARYDALERDLRAVGAAAVPALCEILIVPVEIAFPRLDERDGVSARQLVRALLALAAILKVDAVLPYYVLHTSGPSLTLSSHAALAVEVFGRQDFGYGHLYGEGDADALLAWWREAKDGHRVVLDHLLHGVVRWADDALASGRPEGVGHARFALQRLLRVLGRDAERELPPVAEREAATVLLAAIVDEWLAAKR